MTTHIFDRHGCQIHGSHCAGLDTRTEDRIADLGREHGIAAASWAFDGNTSCETYAKVGRMIDDGDPELYDMFREPSLASDDFSETDLCDETGIDDQDTDARDRAAGLYCNGATHGFWDEIERAVRAHIAGCEFHETERTTRP